MSDRTEYDMVGKRFGLLLVIGKASKRHKRRPEWRCQCDCGVEIVAQGNNLRSGKTTSCGCKRRVSLAALNAKTKRTHGMSETPTYRSWEAMIARCTRATDPGYARYGGRGIQVCDRWLSFAAFLLDMGERPDGTSLDRYPNQSGNYEPTNCRWGTAVQQTRNRRSTRTLTVGGVCAPIAAWADQYGLSYRTLILRLYAGWSTERALQTPKRNSQLRGEVRRAA